LPPDTVIDIRQVQNTSGRADPSETPFRSGLEDDVESHNLDAGMRRLAVQREYRTEFKLRVIARALITSEESPP